MNLSLDLLEAGEKVLWRGRPAPRAYTFRNWRCSVLAIIGLALLLLLRQTGGALSPDFVAERWAVRLLLAGLLWAAIGHLLWARLEWEPIIYLLTDRRLLAVSGLVRRRLQVLPLGEVRRVETASLGKALATVKILGGGRPLTLYCLEHPQLLLKSLFPIIKSGQQMVELGDPLEGV